MSFLRFDFRLALAQVEMLTLPFKDPLEMRFVPALVFVVVRSYVIVAKVVVKPGPKVEVAERCCMRARYCEGQAQLEE